MSVELEHTVVVIIPTLNRSREEVRLLRLFNRHIRTRDVIALTVDQGDHPDGFILPGSVRVYCRRCRGASLARNIGIGVALAMDVDFICFWDDDDIPDEFYVHEMRKALLKNPDAALSACLIEHEGKVRPRESMSTPSRMIRASAIGHHRWDGNGSGTDRRFWQQFDHLKTVYVDRVLYRTGNAQTGGLRDPTGEY